MTPAICAGVAPFVPFSRGMDTMSSKMRLMWAVFALLLLPALIFTAQAQDKQPKEEKKDEKKKDDKKGEPKADEPIDTTADDQKQLKDLGLGIDGPALLDYLKKRTFTEANPKELDKLFVDLGDEEFETREAAFSRL